MRWSQSTLSLPRQNWFATLVLRCCLFTLLGVVCGLMPLKAQTVAYVTNLDDGTVSVIDTATNTVVGSITVGGWPFGVAFLPNGTRAYVTDGYHNTVSVIDTVTKKVVGLPIAVGHYPVAVAITPDGTRAYVTNGDDGTVSVIDTVTNTV